jgi:hypothetical protein
MNMAKQKITGLSASLLEQAAPAATVPEELEAGTASVVPVKPVVQTVKVPPDLYVRLKTIGARERRSSQDIILTAVREYLERFPMASQ